MRNWKSFLSRHLELKFKRSLRCIMFNQLLLKLLKRNRKVGVRKVYYPNSVKITTILTTKIRRDIYLMIN